MIAWRGAAGAVRRRGAGLLSRAESLASTWTASAASTPSLLSSRAASSGLGDAGRTASGTASTASPASPLADLLAFASAPRPAWEGGGVNALSPAQAASRLTAFFGCAPIHPGDVVDLSTPALLALLEATDTSGGRAGDPALDAALFTHADGVTRRFFGTAVFLRGIVEFSNVCQNDCGYCGIRKRQPGIRRYTMPADEVVACATWAHAHGMGTLMLQSGELRSAARMAYLLEVVARVRAATVAADVERDKEAAAAAAAAAPPSPSPSPADPSSLGLRVALSVGEMGLSDFQALKAAGVSRYLLRIETSNPALFAALHPPAQSWDARVAALRDAKAAGLQLGTGVMVGLPGQTLADLAADLAFFKEMDADMIGKRGNGERERESVCAVPLILSLILFLSLTPSTPFPTLCPSPSPGMGPYITEPHTPVAASWNLAHPPATRPAHMRAMVDLTTRMNALARVTLGNVNIAATTALQAVHPAGRELALRRGANVLMPILTPAAYRADYALYEGKPCITDTAAGCEACLKARVAGVGLQVASGLAGDPPHATRAAVPDVVVGRGGGAKAPPSTRGFHTAAGGGGGAPHPTHPTPPPPPPPTLLRTNVAFLGAVNAGKSSALCALAPGAAIIDPTPGTTTDVKVALAELHGVGPVKLMDTAGVDEGGALGAKKRRAALAALGEADVAVVVVDPASAAGRLAAHAALEERGLVEAALAAGATPLLLFNTRRRREGGLGGDSDAAARLLVRHALDPDHALACVSIDLASPGAPTALAAALKAVITSRGGPVTAVPALPTRFLTRGALILLNVPMDAETPAGRLLRPQALVQEEALRAYATTIAHRMDLPAARGEAGPGAQAAERARWEAALAPLAAAAAAGTPCLVITDSQAMDVAHAWTPPALALTTFSIAMAHRQSGGRLGLFVEGLEAVKRLRKVRRTVLP